MTTLATQTETDEALDYCCEYCGENVTEDHYAGDGYCQACWDEDHTHCPACGDEIATDDLVGDVCPECHESKAEETRAKFEAIVERLRDEMETAIEAGDAVRVKAKLGKVRWSV